MRKDMQMIIKQLRIANKPYKQLVLCLTFCLGSVLAFGEPLNPLNYGLLDAKTGLERFRVLEACHKEAVRKGADVSYSGISSIEIEIPGDAKSLPLTRSTDFCGVKLSVLNKTKDIALFAMANSKTEITVPDTDLHKGARLQQLEQLGLKMLVVQDDSLWVYRRRNKPYGATRKDILLINNGVVLNDPVSGYNTRSSLPSVFVCDIDTKGIDFGNITFVRDSISTKKTFLVNFENIYGLTLHDIIINTPKIGTLSADRVISIVNSAKLVIENIRIEGTYSQDGQFGYGIALNNIYDLRINRMYARSNWGIFGNNNIHKAVLKDCDINRFDIHCYGRDVKSVRCKYSVLYNQFSSIYGNVEFEDCEFTNFRPVLMESSYNAYTPFNISFKRCTFNMTEKNNYLLTLFGLEEAHNSRPELSRKALPNITIKDCLVNLPEGLKEWYVVSTGKVRYKETLDYMSHITIDGLTVNQPSRFDLFSSEIRTTTPLNVSIKDMYVMQNGKRKKYVMPYATVDDKAKVKCNGKEVKSKTLADVVVDNRFFQFAVGGLMLTGLSSVWYYKRN